MGCACREVAGAERGEVMPDYFSQDLKSASAIDNFFRKFIVAAFLPSLVVDFYAQSHTRSCNCIPNFFVRVLAYVSLFLLTPSFFTFFWTEIFS